MPQSGGRGGDLRTTQTIERGKGLFSFVRADMGRKTSGIGVWGCRVGHMLVAKKKTAEGMRVFYRRRSLERSARGPS